MERKTNYKVLDYTNRIIKKLEKTLEYSSTKANLSRLRNSIGGNFNQTVSIWEDVYSEMPEEYLSVNGKLTKEEKAVFYTLQLYALHQQGMDNSVNLEIKDKEYMNIGDSFRKLRDIIRMENQDTKSLDRRFNAMITSSDIDELTTHLRHLIGILKRNNTIKIDYPRLSEDLFWYQIGESQKERISLDWGRNYYKTVKKEKGE